MKYFTYPLSGIRKEANIQKEAVSAASIGRLIKIPKLLAGEILPKDIAPTLAAGGVGLGAIGGGIGANSAVNAYERKKQQEDPNYKASILGRIGSILGGAAGGAVGGGILGFAGATQATRNAVKPVTDRVIDIAARHGVSPEYMLHRLATTRTWYTGKGRYGLLPSELDAIDKYILGLSSASKYKDASNKAALSRFFGKSLSKHAPIDALTNIANSAKRG